MTYETGYSSYRFSGDPETKILAMPRSLYLHIIGDTKPLPDTLSLIRLSTRIYA